MKGKSTKPAPPRPTPLPRPTPRPQPTPKKNKNSYDLFEILDNNRDGKLNQFEIYGLFNEADEDRNRTISAEELIKWWFMNTEDICNPFDRQIDTLL